VTTVRHIRCGLAGVAACVFLLAHTGAARAACDGTPLPSGLQMLDVAGARRTFVVRSAFDSDPKTRAPVVFALHPFGMNAQYMQSRAPVGRAWPQAIAVFPDGLSRGRGGGLAPSWQGRPGELADRDLAFFDAMLAWLDEKGCIDKARVFVLGYSNGAGLAYLLACERRAAVAGIAIAAGRLGCSPAGARPVIMSHGVADRTIGYDSAIAASKAWAGANGCAAPPATGVPGCVQGQSCGGGAVTLCTHGGGHEYDGSFTKAAVEFFQSIER
jgi:polyhydroxybutyrate depolymerase